MGGSISSCGSSGGKAGTEPGTNPEVEVAITEVKACIQTLRQREETIEDLRAQVLEKKKGEGLPQVPDPRSAGAAAAPSPPQPRPDPDLSKSTLKQLQAMAAGYEKELGELKKEEQTLRQYIFEDSAYYKRSTVKATATRSTSGGLKGKEITKSAPGVLTEDEQEWIADVEVLLCDQMSWGLSWERKWQGQPMGPKDENMRRSRREGTKKKVTEVLGLWHFGETAWKAKKPQNGGVHVLLDTTPASMIGIAPAGGTFLLGRYDAVAVKVCADLDRNWNFIKGPKNDFWVVHAAALNIGESTRAADFPDFCLPENPSMSGAGNFPTNDNRGRGSLDLEAYLEASEHILCNVCRASRIIGAEHLVFFPFGMGAFLRHLGQNDRRFTSFEEMQRLRRRLARSYMKVLAAATSDSTKVHLCLMFADEETQCNADALLRALAEPSDAVLAKLKARVTVHPEGDCLQLSHELAMKSDKVMLVNGANRALIGNHWFAGRAKMAIDENLHRRSWRMSALAYLLNGFDGREPEGRQPDELQRNAGWIGAQIHTIDCIGPV